jgi:hypothetical protein
MERLIIAGLLFVGFVLLVLGFFIFFFTSLLLLFSGKDEKGKPLPEKQELSS